MNEKTDIYLSKSLFVRGIQCHKSLYLYKYHPELKDEIPPSREAIFKSGSDVGLVAQRLFPGGITIPYEGMTLEEQVALTASAIEKGAVTIYEAAFSHDDIFIKIDILRKGVHGWEIYEVKSSTSLKDIYLPDAAVQYHVLTGAGHTASRAFLVHINNQYVKEGEIRVDELFTVNDVTDLVEKNQDYIMEEIVGQKEMLRGNMPDIDIGPYCNDPYDCDFIGYCWQYIPESSVFSIRGSSALPFKLYSKGIVKLEDVPLDVLPARQRLQVEATLNGKIFISKEAIKDFLDSLSYPLYFLDFETFSLPIPVLDGTRPYQQVPYQYSLHYLDNENAPLKHHEYLALPKIDPREELIKKLVSETPGNACILAYNAGFEAGVLQGLAKWLPGYKDDIDVMLSNLHDLATPFRKRDFYHWQFNGSYSIKMVLPALVVDLNYKDLEIQNGDMAMNAYYRMQELDDPLETEKIRNALLEYCKLDTLAMVKIFEKLKELTQKQF